MNPKTKFRVSTRFQEIFGVIAKAKKGERNFIWKMVKDKRLIIPIDITHVEETENRIETRLREMSDDVKEGDILYLKLDSRDSAFKTEVLEHSGAKVVLAFPDEMIMGENRENIRHYFHATDEKNIQLTHGKNLVSALNEKNYSLCVSDISETGLAAFIPKGEERDFQLKDKVKLEMLGLFALEKSILGEVVFRMPVDIQGPLGSEPGMKVGIQLAQRIPRAMLERFLLKKVFFSISDEKIVGDEAFRKKVRVSLRKMQKTLTEKKAFKDFMAALEIQRADHQHLKQHILLLCEVMSGLGEKLGWAQGKTIDKLIYVAYLHDIRLMDHPKLARIQTKKEFIAMKPRLSQAEQKAFLEAPAYAAELARADSEPFLDVIKVLQQQKELPDGSGFPQGLTAAMLSPLSCLFILSHFFVNYVILHPDWSVEDFSRTYRNKLKGQHFAKIFQAMKD